ncbi:MULTISPECIES: type 3 dihydrofolate reductase [unclassified Oceanobacter]|uniref:type 3 dihydrofolate reductase n=1 Tax=unclassified Oceanobacter TaxID=2620260 RepID=UPI002733D48E|nr:MULTISPECIES: type 3 dihydrofolate reductase [unclassified Oceanobacter]MDP2607824.1 type 3 dihydrofolate reductase [Oceanobacter sp. 1_MG-2023]MDP2610992.1 type 3 dihydrofolate reductase [Oceanobacter sp. 2_MG-2023]
MKLSLIVALSRNHTIGLDNQLPWHLPGDLKYFRDSTMGKPVVMGRKTHESIGRALPGRANIVISRQPDYQADGVAVVDSLECAIELAARLALQTDADEAMIMGGAEIYRQVLPLVERMYLTEVDADIEGDAFFPDFDRSEWRELSSEAHGPSDTNPYPYRFVVYDRIVCGE